VDPILIIMEEGIGNMIMLTPAIRAIKEVRPDLPIHVMGKYPALEIMESWECVDRVLVEPDGTVYDTVFYAVWSSGAQKRYDDYFQSHCRQTGTIEYNDTSVHETECYMNIARYLGYSKPAPAPYCPVREVEIDLPADKPIIGLSDTYLNNGVWQRKSWPHYRELARILIRRGYQVVLLGGRDEADRFRSDEWPEEVIALQGQYSLAETAYLMTKCKAVVANDSGPAHMAAALNIPTYVLFGATLVTKNKPRGEKVHVITSNLPCSPCQYTEACLPCKEWRCMEEISTETILTRIEAEGRPATDLSVSTTPAKNKMTQKPPIFIAGAGRSGTSLVREIINAHPHIACGPELKVTPLVAKLCQDLQTIYLPWLRAYSLSPEDINRIFSGVLLAFLEKYRINTGKERIAEKTPNNIFFFQHLSQMFPRSPLIHVIRDGRDVVASLLTMNWRTATGEPVDYTQDVEKAAIYWAQAVIAGRNFAAQSASTGNQYFEIHYEDIIREPEKTLRDLFAFMDEPWDPFILRDFLPSGTSEDESGADPAGKKLYHSSIGRWRKDLDPRQIEVVKTVAGHLIIELGYAQNLDW